MGPEGAAEVAPDRRGGLRLLLRRSLDPLHLHRVGGGLLQAENEDREDEEEVELHTVRVEPERSEATGLVLDTELSQAQSGISVLCKPVIHHAKPSTANTATGPARKNYEL